jgi:AraC family transcriptional regulator of adaptative response/methylated-DNA-[protein]-cysteine methyltransferase
MSSSKANTAFNHEFFTSDDERWAAVEARSAEADGHFYYSVITTGIYCRPSCPSRAALRENVAFHTTPAEAEGAGFRPCKRCHSDQPVTSDPNLEIVTRACRLIEASDNPPSLDELAKEVGFSKHHFHRLFKKTTGLTPKAYSNACRDRKVRDGLATKRSVTDVIFDAGFNSGGRFYEKSTEALGMKPKKLRAGGKGESIRFAVAECSLGTVLIGTTDQGVCSVLLGDTPEALITMFQDQFPLAELIGGDDKFNQWVAGVLAIVDATGTPPELPLDICGTAFQQRVWKALRKIPAGETASYADIARQIGAPKSFRAAAQACGANKLAVVIPCHRVVRSDGGLSGYR